MKNILLLLGFLLISQATFAQFGKKTKTIEIESSIQCGMCVDRLENSFADFWAVKNVDYEIEDQKIIVTYNSKKTSPEKIRKHIAKVGYDADDVAADKEAYEGLPGCCKKGAHIPEKDDEKK